MNQMKLIGIVFFVGMLVWNAIALMGIYNTLNHTPIIGEVRPGEEMERIMPIGIIDVVCNLFLAVIIVVMMYIGRQEEREDEIKRKIRAQYPDYRTIPSPYDPKPSQPIEVDPLSRDDAIARISALQARLYSEHLVTKEIAEMLNLAQLRISEGKLSEARMISDDICKRAGIQM